MSKDRQGNPLSGATAQTAELYDQAIHAFNTYRGDPIALLDRAIAATPEFAMAHVAKAHLYAIATEPAAVAAAATLLETAKGLPVDTREGAHIAALAHVLDGEWTRAALAFDQLNIRYPRDLLALQTGHLVDFFRASARSLRDRIARVLPDWSASTPGYSILLGMYAFGLEECGDYARAEQAGRQALALQPLDCWAHHAVAHVMEMQGRPEDGIGWMLSREPYWSGDDNSFKVHNWWHKAVFHLDLGQVAEALALYDGPVRENRSSVVVDLVDASSLLWRLHLAGAELGERWSELAQAWDAHADGRTYAFNDWHAVMVYLGAGRDQDVARVSADLHRCAATTSETARWVRETGLPLVRGFTAFWRGDFSAACEQLWAARRIANSFGGSHAQRDIIDRTLLEAALRSGAQDLARALAHERLALKPHSQSNAAFLRRAMKGLTAASQAA